MKYVIMPLLSLLTTVQYVIAQTEQVKHVICNGGSINAGTSYTSFSVVGQLAASEFSTGSHSGTIGYLDASDNDPNSVLLTNESAPLFRISPNPSTSDVFIDFETNDKDEFVVVILNNAGVKVYERSYQRNANNRYLLNANIFPVTGNYTVNIHHRNNNYSQKLSIIK